MKNCIVLCFLDMLKLKFQKRRQYLMEYVKALLIKFVMTTAVLWVVLGAFYGASFASIFILSLIIAGLSFVLGDLFILPKFENWGATISDFLLVFLAVWLYSANVAIVNYPAITAAAMSAILISIGEVFFHKYVDSHILNVDDRTGGRTQPPRTTEDHLQTEFGDEIDPLPE